MRLRLETADRNPYWLVGDPALNERTEQSSSLADQIQMTRNQQVVSGADWENVLALDRGNQSITITATTRMEFVSEIERMDFISSLGATAPEAQLHRWGGDVVVRIDSADGLTFQEYVLPSSTVALAALRLDAAVGLLLTYRVNNGGFGPRSITGETGGIYNLTASVPDSTFGIVTLAAIEAAVQARFDAGDTVVAFGVCSAIRNPSSSSRPLRLDQPSILFFKDASAYATYLGSAASLYALANVGDWLEVTPGSGVRQWKARQSNGSLLAGCVGFTLPISNVQRYWSLADLSYFDCYHQGEFLLGYTTGLLTNQVSTLRVVTLSRNIYGALVYTIHDPLATFSQVVDGDANLIGTSSVGADFNLTAFSENS